MKQLLSGIVFFILIYSASGQKSLNDWIVLNNGDTLYGTIREKDWNVNPDKITFTKTIEKTYSISDLISFDLPDAGLYRRYTVSRLLMPNREDAIYPEEEEKSDTVTVWLKLIVESNISLGALYQKDRVYFYVIDKTGNPIELICSQGIRDFNRDKFKNDPRYKKILLYENPIYKNQLYSIFSDKIDSYNIDNLQYSEQSLGRLFRKMNNIEGSNPDRKSFYIGISGGVSLFSSHTSGSSGTIFGFSDIRTATMPYLRLSFNFESSKKRSRVSFSPEVGLSIFNTTGTKSSSGITGKYEIKNTFFETALMTRFVLNNPSAKQRIFLAGGIDMYFTLSSENNYMQDLSSSVTKINAQKFIASPSITAGYLYSKASLYINYQYLGNLTTYLNSSWKVNRISAGISYFFKK